MVTRMGEETSVVYEDNSECSPGASRTLLVRNLNRFSRPELLQQEFSKFGSLSKFISTHLYAEGFVIVEFHDIRDAEKLHKTTSLVLSFNPALCQPGTRLDVHYSTLAKTVGPHPHENEGRILISGLQNISAADAVKLFERFGDVHKVIASVVQGEKLYWVVEFFDIRAAGVACTVLNGIQIQNSTLKVTFLNGYTSWVSAGFAESYPLPPTNRMEVQSLGQLEALAESSLGSPAAQQPNIRRARRFSLSPLPSRSRSPSPTRPASPLFYFLNEEQPSSSPSSSLADIWSFCPSSPPHSDPAASFLSSPPSSPPARAMSPPAHHHHQHQHQHHQQHHQQHQHQHLPPAQLQQVAAPTFPTPVPPPHHHHHHQQQQQQHQQSPLAHLPQEPKHQPHRIPDNFQIDVEAIRRGLDRRTTLMVRNIPNKYTQDMFLEFINETHKGLYDFIYLPIDFKNKCNVGYAFINFIDPKSIPSLFRRIQGKKWSRFNSEKICAVSYARIQGKDNLIRHFQNSTIMSECSDYRPKIFFSSGPLMGKEEPFPEPNLHHEALPPPKLGGSAGPVQPFSF